MQIEVDFSGLKKIIGFFKRKKKEPQKVNVGSYNNDEYNIRKNYIYSSGMFEFIKNIYIKHYAKFNEVQDAEHGVLDTCIGIVCMDQITKQNLDDEYKMGWECATGVHLPSYTYVAMIDDLLDNHMDKLKRYIEGYKDLNLK